jgi:hypothetical protein
LGYLIAIKVIEGKPYAGKYKRMQGDLIALKEK